MTKRSIVEQSAGASTQAANMSIAIAQPAPKICKIIHADLLIPGVGEPLQKAALVFHEKTIVWVGKQGDLPQEYHSNIAQRFDVPFLMPGLWDCHTHFAGSYLEANGMPPYLDFISVHPASQGARLARGCWEAIQNGYTSMRDMGGFGCEVAKAIQDGSIVGPNIYSAGAAISQLAGHGDIFVLPAGDALLNLGVGEVRPGHFGTNITCLADGIDECRRAVRLQIRRGAKCIKILAAGGIMSAEDSVLIPQYSVEELEVMVKEANRMGRSVAAHAHAKVGILNAIKAGVTTIEHGSFVDKECVDLMKANGTVYVPTASVFKKFEELGSDGALPPFMWEKAKLAIEGHRRAYRLAIQNGVTIALGADTAPGLPVAREIELAVEAGLSNLEALQAATANGPLTVKGQVPLTGQLRVGYEADFIGVLKNPVEDVKVLQHRDNIKWVWKGGKLLKGPGVGPWGEDDGFFKIPPATASLANLCI